MKILITGATGFIGTALCKLLQEQGHDLIAFVRDTVAAKSKIGSNIQLVTALDTIAGDEKIDAIINLAGEAIAGGRWTGPRKKLLLDSRIETTKALVALCNRLAVKPSVMISGSAAGYYGRRGAEVVTEDDGPQDIFMSQLCARWEAAAAPVSDLGVRLVIPRISVVLGQGGGALAQLMLPHKMGLGTRFGAGDNYFPWIHLSDLLAFFSAALTDTGISGPYNMGTADTHTQDSFNRVLAGVMKRPYFMWMPAGPLRLCLGEMADLFVEGQHLSSDKLLETGFTPQFPTLQSALEDLIPS